MEEIIINEIIGSNIIATLVKGNTKMSITNFDLIANPHLITFDNRIFVKIILGNTNEPSNNTQACEILLDVINRNLFAKIYDKSAI
jgi:hypothetical protein